MAADPGTVLADPADFSEALPAWFVVGLTAVLIAIVCFGAIGLSLAIAGAFSPLPTLTLGLVATVALVVAVAPWQTATPRGRATNLPAGAALVVAGGATVFAMRHHAQHVLLDRDPGGYTLIARWMATHHNLEFNAKVGAFAQTPGLKYSSAAVFDRGDGHIYFQFSHLLPTLLAMAHWIGGDRLMFVGSPMLGGLGLLCFYALATRFVRPWIAFAAMTALAADLVELHFMRDSYSELATQIAMLGGLWLLTRRGAPRPALAAFTGLLLGASVMARIDGPLYLIAIPFFLGTTVYAWRRGEPDGRAKFVAGWWLAAGTAVTTLIGYLDVRLRSEKYLHDLGSRVPLLYVALAFACLVTVGIAAAAPRLASWPARALRGRFPDAAAIAGALGLFAAWFVRPHVQHVTHSVAHPFIASLQVIDHVPIQAQRRYYEDTLVWHSWYLGPIALAAGIVGLGLLTRELLRGRGGPKGLVVTAFLPVAAVYLWNPNIFPDQIWVMRRYLPLVIPGFVIFGFVVIDRLLAARAGKGQNAARAGAIVLLVAAIGWPIHTDWRVRGDTAQLGFLAPIEQICHTVGRNAAVIVLQGGNLEQVLPQTLRSFCNVPVAVRIFDPKSPALNTAGLANLATRWQHDGRTLFLVGDSTARIDHIVPGLQPILQTRAFDGLHLQERIVGRPDGFRVEAYDFAVARMP